MPGVPICPNVAYMCSNGQRLHHPRELLQLFTISS